jgi:hydroxypyruvate isomerase
MQAHPALIGRVQIAGNPSRQAPNGGEINYPYLFDRLDDVGYSGWVDCKYRPRGNTVAGLGACL